MQIIKIEAQKNGAHFNNKSDNITKIPEGWAQIPDDMPIPDTFPFVNLEVAKETRYKEIPRYNEETEKTEIELVPYTVTVVTRMTPGVVPEPDPVPIIPSPETELTAEKMANAILEGVNDI